MSLHEQRASEHRNTASKWAAWPADEWSDCKLEVPPLLFWSRSNCNTQHFFCWSTLTSGHIKAVNPACKQAKALHIVYGVTTLLRRAVAELHDDSFDPCVDVLRHKQCAHLVTEIKQAVAA